MGTFLILVFMCCSGNTENSMGNENATSSESQRKNSSTSHSSASSSSPSSPDVAKSFNDQVGDYLDAQGIPYEEGEKGKKKKKEKEEDPIKDVIRTLIKTHCKFTFVGEEDKLPYVVIGEGEERKIYRLSGSEFRGLVRLWINEKYGKEFVVGKTALNDALEHTADIIMYQKKVKMIYTRIGIKKGEHDLGRDDVIYWNLGHRDNRYVRISKDGWDVTGNTPLAFCSIGSMRPAFQPEEGGKVEDLWEIFNVADDEKILFLSWILHYFRPVGTFPILVLNGEPGSAKSTATTMIKKLLDPSYVLLRSHPKDVDAIKSYAYNTWLMAYDNISNIDAEFSDYLCGLATGTGFGNRKMYDNVEEHVVKVKRFVILNGITTLVSRGDMAQRSINLNLPVIETYRSESEMDKVFDALAPRILGALCGVVAEGLGKIKDIPYKPRLADYAIWGCTCERIMGFEEGSFLRVYSENTKDLETEIIQSSPLVILLTNFIKGDDGFGLSRSHNPIKKKLSSEILQMLEKYYKQTNGDRVQMPKWFPDTPRYFSDHMKRYGHLLRKHGFAVSTQKQHNMTYWTIVEVEADGEYVDEVSEAEQMEFNDLSKNFIGDEEPKLNSRQGDDDL